MSLYMQFKNQVKQNIKELTQEELSSFLADNPNALLIDIREQQETDQGIIPNALVIPRGVLEGNIERAAHATDTPVVLYCAGGGRSALSAESLQRMGYTNVYSLAGGYGGWIQRQ